MSTTIWTMFTETDDVVGRTASLFIGIVIGYTAGCVRRTMMYARMMKREIHEIHVELDRIDAKTDTLCHHPLPEVKDETSRPQA